MTQERDDQPLAITEPFDAFYVREFPKMVALAAAVSGSRSLAEDIAQEAMLRAHRRWEQVARYDKPGAWVRRVTINVATSAVRRRAVEARKLARLGATGAVLAPPEPEDEAVWEAVGRLPGKQRAAVALFYLEDRSTRDIAQILECSESTARVHLHRGRAALAAALSAHGGDA